MLFQASSKVNGHECVHGCDSVNEELETISARADNIDYEAEVEAINEDQARADDDDLDDDDDDLDDVYDDDTDDDNDDDDNYDDEDNDEEDDNDDDDIDDDNNDDDDNDNDNDNDDDNSRAIEVVADNLAVENREPGKTVKYGLGALAAGAGLAYLANKYKVVRRPNQDYYQGHHGYGHGYGYPGSYNYPNHGYGHGYNYPGSYNHPNRPSKTTYYYSSPNYRAVDLDSIEQDVENGIIEVPKERKLSDAIAGAGGLAAGYLLLNKYKKYKQNQQQYYQQYPSYPIHPSYHSYPSYPATSYKQPYKVKQSITYDCNHYYGGGGHHHNHGHPCHRVYRGRYANDIWTKGNENVQE